MLTNEDIQEQFSSYTVPLRGIHLRPKEMIIQIIPAGFNSEYYVVKTLKNFQHSRLKAIHRQEVYSALMLASDLEKNNSFPLGINTHEIELRPTGTGLKDQIDVWITLDPIAIQENLFLHRLVNRFNEVSFNLGHVPFHCDSIRKMFPTFSEIFNKGLIKKFEKTQKNKIRIRVDIPYIRKILHNMDSLLLSGETQSISLQSKQYSKLALELD
jgi:hypothetical protein